MPNLSRQSSFQPRSRLGNTRSMIPVPVRRDSASRNPFSTAPTNLPPRYTQHAALRGEFAFSPEEWHSVNRRIIETVNIVLPHGYLIQGPGPWTYELHAKLGVALVADIAIRPIERPCSLAHPGLQRRIRDMANDPRRPGFRYTYRKGKVWFFFRVIDADLARQPLSDNWIAEAGLYT